MMNRIIYHHTGGGYTPNGLDLNAYHGVVDGDGQRREGKFPVLANAPGRIRKGRYAAHTRNLNTGSIGRAIGAMLGGQWSDPFGGKCPVKPQQVDALVLWVADDCREWGIPVEREFVLSHAEVEITLGVKQRNKWDFDYGMRGRAGRDPIAIGDEFRQEVRLKLGADAPVVSEDPDTLRQGSEGKFVKLMQKRLGITADGDFGPITRAAVVTFQRRHNLLPDGIVGPMTWAAMFPEGAQ